MSVSFIPPHTLQAIMGGHALSRPYVASAKDRARKLIQGWNETPEARKTLALIDYLERLSDAMISHDELRNVAGNISDELNALECKLFDLRDAALDQACTEWPDNGEEHGEDYVRDALDELGLTVSAAIKQARKARLGDTLEIGA